MNMSAFLCAPAEFYVDSPFSLNPLPLSQPPSLCLCTLSFHVGQECFNFKDRLHLSGEVEWHVFQEMRCEACKIIRTEETKSSLYWTDLITVNRD